MSVYDVGFVVLVGLTSLAAYLAGARWRALSRVGLPAAVRATLETVGLAVLFMAGNLVLAALGVALARLLTGRFVAVYAIDDLALTGASVLQAILFRWWLGPRG